MTVATTAVDVTYVPNGATTVFAIPFAFADADHVKVELNGTLLNAGYSVAGAGDEDGGTLTMDVAPAASTSLYVYRETPLLQEVAPVNNSTVFASVLGRGLDLATMRAQEAAARIEEVNDDLEDAIETVADDLAAAIEEAGTTLGFAGKINKIDTEIFASDLDILSDSTDGTDGTDQTAALLAVIADLLADDFKGTLHIARGTRFTPKTIYDAVYPGLVLQDWSAVNFGQPPTYRSELRVTVFGDSESYDAVPWTVSGHQPAQGYNNTGSSGSLSGQRRRASPVLYAAGINSDGDKSLVFQELYEIDPATKKASVKRVLYATGEVALGDPYPHDPGETYAVGDLVFGVGNAVYRAASAGVAGATTPTGTGTGFSDGTVLWDYVQAARNREATIYEADEDGNVNQYGPAPRHTLSAPGQIGWLEMQADGEFVLRHQTAGVDAFTVSTTKGFQPGVFPSRRELAITTAVFAMPVTGCGTAAIPALTQCTAPVGLAVGAILKISFGGSTGIGDYFDGGSPTPNFFLRDGIGVTPPADADMTFRWDGAFWREIYRSFTDNRKGTTAQRPQYGGAKGVGNVYLDTTLAAAGKPIFWTGTTWVDATGTAV